MPTFSEASLDARIIIVDDEEDSFALLRHLLKRVGATEPVQWFSDGDSALRHLHELADQGRPLPMLLIVDLKMGGMSGFDVLRALRAHPALARLLTIVVSSSSLPEDIARALQLGAFCYFEKYPLPEKFARVYQVAKNRLPFTDHVPDACETALRRIIELVEDAIGICHLPGMVLLESDRKLLNLLGSIRRGATERLLERMNKPEAAGRWPFEAPAKAGAQAG